MDLTRLSTYDFDELYARYSRYPGYHVNNIVIWDVEDHGFGTYTGTFLSNIRYVAGLKRYCVCAPDELLFLYSSSASYYYPHMSMNFESLTNETHTYNSYQPLHSHYGLTTQAEFQTIRTCLRTSDIEDSIIGDADTLLICPLPLTECIVSDELIDVLHVRQVKRMRSIGLRTDADWMYTVYFSIENEPAMCHAFYHSVHVIKKTSLFSEFQTEFLKHVRLNLSEDIHADCPGPHGSLDCEDPVCYGECDYRDCINGVL